MGADLAPVPHSYACGLNIVEVFFIEMTRSYITSIRGQSKEELIAGPNRSIQEINEYPVIFRRVFMMDELLIWNARVVMKRYTGIATILASLYDQRLVHDLLGERQPESLDHGLVDEEFGIFVHLDRNLGNRCPIDHDGDH
jgi:hypothetical protein